MKHAYTSHSTLAHLARQARQDILQMSYCAQVGHVPSALSMVDYLCAVFGGLVDPTRDIVVLGKPYGAQAYYAVFAAYGWIENDWDAYGSADPQWRYCIGREHSLVTFIDDTMGNALSVACGIALDSDRRVYVNTGDAYFQSGSAWEAVMFAGAHKLGNLVLTVDCNDMQVLGRVSDILDVQPLAQRLEAFGWRATSVPGHDFDALRPACAAVAASDGRPSALVMRTIKGRGVSFMENSPAWHYRRLSRVDLDIGMRELR